MDTDVQNDLEVSLISTQASLFCHVHLNFYCPGNVRASNLKEHREDPVMNSQNGAAVPAIRRVWEDRFPEDTRLMVYNNRSRVAMNPQSSIIKDFITAAIEKFKIDLLFNPPILNIKDNQHQKHQMLIDCANLLVPFPRVPVPVHTDTHWYRSLVNGTCQYIWGVVGLYKQHVCHIWICIT